MHLETNKGSAESLKKEQKHINIPTDGFVNVNDIVRKRRQLRNAEFNTADHSWDADLNIQYNGSGDKVTKEER